MPELFGQNRALGEVYDAVPPSSRRSADLAYAEAASLIAHGGSMPQSVWAELDLMRNNPPNPSHYDEMIDMLIRAGMSNDAIEDEIRNLETRGELNDMRADSVTGAMGQVNTEEIERLMSGMSKENFRKRLSPEMINNLGAMYGTPLNQARIDYFEDKMNRDPNQSYNGKYPNFPPE